MQRASKLVPPTIGAVGVLFLVGCATTSEPVAITAEDADGVFAAECAMAAMLQQSKVMPGSDFYTTMTDVIDYWAERQDALTPDEERREEQGEYAVKLLRDRVGPNANVLELGVVLSECRARREELASGGSE